MLAPEEAQRRLAEFAVADPGAALQERVAKLPARLRAIADEHVRMHTRTHVAHWGTPAGATWRVDRARELDALSAADRTRIFTAFFPKLGAEVELGWRALASHPYQESFARRAFRSPRHPEHSASKRVGWLGELLDVVSPYEQDVAWLATWTGHFPFPWRCDTTARLLAAVIDAGGPRGEDVLRVLIATTDVGHEIAVFGRYVIRALATCSRPEAWAVLERLVLRAQREEGLRQVVFETVDEAHPECFRRMLALIAEHGLARFSAVARATDVWLAMQWDSQAAKHVHSISERLARWIPDADARRAAMDSDIAEDVYLALYAEALEDSVRAVERARPLLAHARAEVRYAAAYLLAELDHEQARSALVACLGDADHRVSARAVDAFAASATCSPAVPDLFERLEAELARWPDRAKKQAPIVWPWCAHDLDRARIGRALLRARGDRPFARFEPHLGALDVLTRSWLANGIANHAQVVDGEARPLVLKLLGDASPDVRSSARKALAATKLRREEEEACEALLTRKADDLRLGVIALLLDLDDARVQASAERLLASRHAEQRTGGLELLRHLHEADRVRTWCRARAAAYRAVDGKRTAAEEAHLDAIERKAPEAFSLEDALGLSPVAARTPLSPLRKTRVEIGTKAAREVLRELDALITAHAATEVEVEYSWGTQRKIPLGEFSDAFVQRPKDGDRAASLAKMPLRADFETYWSSRRRSSRDADGLEGVRALILADSDGRSNESKSWIDGMKRLLGGGDRVALQFPRACAAYLEWFLYLDPPAGARALLLDVLEPAIAPRLKLEDDEKGSNRGSPEERHFDKTWERVLDHWHDTRAAWTDDELRRLWDAWRRSGRHCELRYAQLGLWFDVLERGIARDEDLIGHLIQPAIVDPLNPYAPVPGTHALVRLSGRKSVGGEPIPPRVLALVQRVRERLIEIELARGDADSISSRQCALLAWTGGLDVLARASRALVGGSLRRGSSASAREGREAFLSHIVQRTRPAAEDSPERFAAAIPPREVGEERLLEIALFAPQWCAHVEHALGWNGLADAVWWMHAHTKDSHWSVDDELREIWKTQTSERTPLTAEDLLDGAVDVAWFERVRAELGDEKVTRMLALAKYTSSGSGHTRAKLFASALLGTTKPEEILERITGKRHLDSVRALGLVPLSKREHESSAELLSRYLALQEFIRGSKQFGSARQASEKRAAAIGLDNLARTAGYPDPVRLEWAMERAALGELTRGSLRQVAGEVEVELSIDSDGDAQLVATKQGKTLKSIPATAKKNDAVKQLVEQAAALTKQKRRMRTSLEEAMIRGDEFTPGEIEELLEHPVLAPLLERLVLVGESARGYPRDAGHALLAHDGSTTKLARAAKVRIAHPLDLLATSEWSAWQRDALRREIIQPFKQVFRELYVLTDAEREERLRSRRYAGHQAQSRQAMALLGTRGWTWRAEEGPRRVDYASGTVAGLEFLNAPYTPAEVEGLTIENVTFTRRGTWTPLALESIPPRFLSEVLRDIDLVVSVASRSGIDPEASMSSVESRAALVRETCALLSISNVTIDGRHVVIQGTLGRYTVHLGSGIVHQLPGGHVCIVPVHAQHRGRVFLPFADDDPKTAEILSKVLLLARDREIKDPTILEQIRR